MPCCTTGSRSPAARRVESDPSADRGLAAQASALYPPFSPRTSGLLISVFVFVPHVSGMGLIRPRRSASSLASVHRSSAPIQTPRAHGSDMSARNVSDLNSQLLFMSRRRVALIHRFGHTTTTSTLTFPSVFARDPPPAPLRPALSTLCLLAPPTPPSHRPAVSPSYRLNVLLPPYPTALLPWPAKPCFSVSQTPFMPRLT